jgi:hypothetical protein
MEVKSGTCACLPRPAFASSTNNYSGSFAISRHTLHLSAILLLHFTTRLPRQHTAMIEHAAKGYATYFHSRPCYLQRGRAPVLGAVRHPAFTPLMSR